LFGVGGGHEGFFGLSRIWSIPTNHGTLSEVMYPGVARAGVAGLRGRLAAIAA
jgi:hypothetical protein